MGKGNKGKQSSSKKQQRGEQRRVPLSDVFTPDKEYAKTTGKSKKNKNKDKYSYESDSKNADYAFMHKLESNFDVREMDSDGNCLFRALSDQLYGDYGRKYYVDVREDVCKYLEEHEDDFKFFVVLDDESDCDEEEGSTSYAEYIKRMRSDGEWGGNPELVAAARAFGRNITVLSAVGSLQIESKPPSEDKKKNNRDAEANNEPPLLVSYHENDHYNSCRSLHDDKPSTRTPTKSSSKSAASQKVSNEAKKAERKKRNELCDCGSGAKYRKCCGSKAAKNKNTNSDDKGKEEIVDGFKVLRI
mmetsp:Transcript_32719/g.47341  ORF Transcript_32719/g.47341 Transcript_32719/m.47341 type:complete len:302 (-) Transcript_32719:401-1306(-)